MREAALRQLHDLTRGINGIRIPQTRRRGIMLEVEKATGIPLDNVRAEARPDYDGAKYSIPTADKLKALDIYLQAIQALNSKGVYLTDNKADGIFVDVEDGGRITVWIVDPGNIGKSFPVEMEDFGEGFFNHFFGGVDFVPQELFQLQEHIARERTHVDIAKLRELISLIIIHNGFQAQDRARQQFLEKLQKNAANKAQPRNEAVDGTPPKAPSLSPRKEYEDMTHEEKMTYERMAATRQTELIDTYDAWMDMKDSYLISFARSMHSENRADHLRAIMRLRTLFRIGMQVCRKPFFAEQYKREIRSWGSVFNSDDAAYTRYVGRSSQGVNEALESTNVSVAKRDPVHFFGVMIKLCNELAPDAVLTGLRSFVMSCSDA